MKCRHNTVTSLMEVTKNTSSQKSKQLNNYTLQNIVSIFFCFPTEGEGDILFLTQIPLASALAWQFLVCTISWTGF